MFAHRQHLSNKCVERWSALTPLDGCIVSPALVPGPEAVQVPESLAWFLLGLFHACSQPTPKVLEHRAHCSGSCRACRSQGSEPWSAGGTAWGGGASSHVPRYAGHCIPKWMVPRLLQHAVCRAGYTNRNYFAWYLLRKASKRGEEKLPLLTTNPSRCVCCLTLWLYLVRTSVGTQMLWVHFRTCLRIRSSAEPVRWDRQNEPGSESKPASKSAGGRCWIGLGWGNWDIFPVVVSQFFLRIDLEIYSRNTYPFLHSQMMDSINIS